MTSSAPSSDVWRSRWQGFSAGSLRAFHAYANWLLSISWRRFLLLSVLLVIAVGIVHDLPPFTWTVTERIESEAPRAERVPKAPKVPKVPKAPPPADVPIRVEGGKPGEGVDISIGKDGIRIRQRGQPADSAASAASAAQARQETARLAADHAASAVEQGLRAVPGGLLNDKAVKAVVEEARRQIEESIREVREAAEEAARDAAEAQRDAERALAELSRAERRSMRWSTRVTRFGIGDFMMQFASLWVLASAILKFTYKGQKQAEVKAAQATETAEAESLKRQVAEARMAAMQAQVEPHFLFNTLASIDHLIETDPARASIMQKNLIALLRASMPTMREASGNGSGAARDLGRELAVIRPYLEILKVRMEERLSTDIQVPEGLMSAEFPPMMIQTLVENAIKHGLEPKPEGGSLRLAAEIVHGKLQVSVADTGLGFGMAATAGTGVGLANVRERLQLLYGPKASLTVAQNQPSGTVVTVTVPYKAIEGNTS